MALDSRVYQSSENPRTFFLSSGGNVAEKTVEVKAGKFLVIAGCWLLVASFDWAASRPNGTRQSVPENPPPTTHSDSFTSRPGSLIVWWARFRFVAAEINAHLTMKKPIIRGIVVLLVLLVLAVGASIYFLGSIVKKGVETVGPQITKTEIKLDSATLSLLSGSGKLKGLLVGNPEGFKTQSAIKVGSVSVGVVASSVFSDKVRVTQVNVQAPEITFEGGLKGNNLSKLLDNVQAATGGSDKTSATSKDKSRKLQVDDFVISGGKINLSIDAGPLGGKSATVPLPEIHLTNLGSGPEGITAGDLTAKVLKELLQAAIPAAEKAVVDLGKGATGIVKEAGKTATDEVGKATKGIGDLFKKK